MKDERALTYTAENFSVINQYVDRMAQRHEAAIQRHRALTSEVYLRWAVGALAVCGLSAALIIWALAALKEKPAPLIVEPRVVQPSPVNVTIEGLPSSSSSTGSTVVSEVRKAAQETVKRVIAGSPQPNEAGVPSSPPAAEVVNFVIFRDLPFVRGKVNQVHIGMKYEKATDEKPSSQWCYINAPNPSGTSVRVTLANKLGAQRYDEQLTATIAREVGLNLGDLNAAQRLCAFD